MTVTSMRSRALSILMVAACVPCLVATTAHAQGPSDAAVGDPPDIPILDGVDLTTQRDAAIQEMLKINPDLQVPKSLPPVDPAQVTNAPDIADEHVQQAAVTPRSACRGQTLYQGFRGGIGLFTYRASSYTDVRCTGPILYSCRARVQNQLAGVYTTVATGPLGAASLGRICQSSVNSGSFVRDFWRTNDTYTLVLYDRSVWGPPTSFCPIGSGTPVLRCAARDKFRNGDRGRSEIF